VTQVTQDSKLSRFCSYESGDIIYRDGEVVWKPVPYERLTEGQKAYLERMQSDEDVDLH